MHKPHWKKVSGRRKRLINVNKNTKRVRYTSIPNNVYVENKRYKNPITTEEFEAAFGIKITRVFELEPDIIGEFVENNHGIEVINEFDFKQGENVFNEGQVRIDQGKELVDFISMRKFDPRGYDGRNDRIIAVYEKLFINEKFLSDILNIEKITAFDKVLQSSSDFEMENKTLMEPLYIDGIYSEKISEKNVEVFRQAFND